MRAEPFFIPDRSGRLLEPRLPGSLHSLGVTEKNNRLFLEAILWKDCIDPAESAQVKPLMHMPQLAFSCPAPDVGVGYCKS